MKIRFLRDLVTSILPQSSSNPHGLKLPISGWEIEGGRKEKLAGG